MINLPSLPLNNEEPDGSTVKLKLDSHGRHLALIIEDGLIIDRFGPDDDPVSLLQTVAANYPNAQFAGDA